MHLSSIRQSCAHSALLAIFPRVTVAFRLPERRSVLA